MTLFDKQTLKKPWEQDLKLQVTPITSINQFKQGGIMYKYQQGGAVSNDPMDQIAQLSAAFLQGDTKSGQQLVEILNNKEIGPQLIKAVQQGVKQQDQRATIIAQAIQTLTQGNTRKARLGAKLNYIRQSIGECPEGEEVIYFKKGGEICKMCSSKKLQKGGKSDPIKILQLYTKYRLQKDAYDPEAENTLNQLKAEENEVHDLDSFIDEIKYRWKGNPWLGGYNKTLNEIFSWPSRYDTFKKSTNPTKDNSIPKFIDPKQFIKPVKDFKKKKEQDAVKKSYELNPYTRGKSAKEIAKMQKRNNQEASRGEGESPADIAPWRKKRK